MHHLANMFWYYTMWKLQLYRAAIHYWSVIKCAAAQYQWNNLFSIRKFFCDAAQNWIQTSNMLTFFIERTLSCIRKSYPANDNLYVQRFPFVEFVAFLTLRHLGYPQKFVGRQSPSFSSSTLPLFFLLPHHCNAIVIRIYIMNKIIHIHIYCTMKNLKKNEEKE